MTDGGVQFMGVAMETSISATLSFLRSACKPRYERCRGVRRGQQEPFARLFMTYCYCATCRCHQVLDSLPKFRSEGPRSAPLCDRRGNCPLMDLFSEQRTAGRDG